MPLQKQNVWVPFGGLDTSKPQALLMPGKVKILENGYQKRSGEIVKRDGMTALTRSTTAGGTINNAIHVATFDNELIQRTQDGLYSYSTTAAKWNPITSFPTYSATVRGLSQANKAQRNPDCAVNGNIAVFVWEETGAGTCDAYYLVQDIATSQLLVPRTLLKSQGGSFAGGFGVKPRCAKVGTKIAIFYAKDGGGLYARTIDVSTPTTLGAETTPAGGAIDVAAGTVIYDVQTMTGSSPEQIAILWNNGANVRGTSVIADLTQYAGLANIVAASTDNDTCVGFPTQDYSDSDIWVLTGGTSGNLHMRARKQSDFTAGTGTTITTNEAPAGWAGPCNITGYRSGATKVIFAHYENNTNRYDDFVFRYDGTTASEWLRGHGLGGKVLSGAAGYYVPVVFGTAPQEAMFLVDASSKALAARVLVGNGGGILNVGSALRRGTLPAWATLSGSRYLLAALRKTRIETQANVNYTATGVSALMVTANDAAIAPPRQLGGNLFLPGAAPRIYDGTTVTEDGFNEFPIISVAHGANVGGNIPNGTYSYVGVYEWTDSRGNVHRSAPSAAVTRVETSGTGTNLETVTFSTLRLTEKTGVVLSIYRTQASGTIYYKITSMTTPVTNDATVDTVTYSDGASDATIASGEILYTTGGVLDHTPPPACLSAEVFGGRLWLGGCESRTDLWYSGEYKTGVGVWFNDTSVLRVDDSDGDLLCVGAFDDKLVAFKKSAVYIVSGDGPNDLGQGSFAIPARLTLGVGTSEPESIVRMVDGLMFKSTKGIYLLTRGLNAEYVGAAVDLYNPYNITGATVVYDKNQVRFTTSDQYTLVYDWYHKDEKGVGQWSIYIPQLAASSCLWGSTWVYCKSDGTVEQEVIGQYNDDGVAITTSMALGPLSFAGILGFQRLYRFQVLGDWYDTHQLRIALYYDHQETSSGETFNITLTGTPERAEARPKIQKCTSVLLTIKDVFSSSGTRGFSFYGLNFVVGVKPGMQRLPAASIMTGS